MCRPAAATARRAPETSTIRVHGSSRAAPGPAAACRRCRGFRLRKALETPAGLPPPDQARDRRCDGLANAKYRCRETQHDRAPAAAFPQGSGSESFCRRHWRRRWRRWRLPRSLATPYRAPERRRRTHRGFRRAGSYRFGAEIGLHHRRIAHHRIGSPEAIAVPWSSTRTCEASAITARITCSIKRIVNPLSWFSARSIPTMRSVSVGRSPAMTSSSSNNCGSVASARATSSRLRSGNVSVAAIRLRFSKRSSCSSNVRARVARSFDIAMALQRADDDVVLDTQAPEKAAQSGMFAPAQAGRLHPRAIRGSVGRRR